MSCRIAFFWFAFVAAVAQAETAYLIGNSLTYDSQGSGLAQATSGLEAIAAQDGVDLEAGFHIDFGKALIDIWSDPNGENVMDPDIWPTALLSSYDFVTLQPHQGTLSTLSTDRQNITNFIDYAAGSPVFFVLQTWPEDDPNEPGWPYSEYWTETVVDDPATPTIKKRQYFDHLMAHTRADNADTTIWMIPTGEVLYELDQQIQAGTLPDVESRSDFMRDEEHMDRAIGRYMATTTLYATMFQKDPRGNTPPSGYFTNGHPLTPALLEAINETIWDVVSSSPWTGYSDFNRDGLIDGADLAEWETSGTSGQNFLAWQRQVTYGPQIQSVPEPATLSLLLIALACVFGSPVAVSVMPSTPRVGSGQFWRSSKPRCREPERALFWP